MEMHDKEGGDWSTKAAVEMEMGMEMDDEEGVDWSTKEAALEEKRREETEMHDEEEWNLEMRVQVVWAAGLKLRSQRTQEYVAEVTIAGRSAKTGKAKCNNGEPEWVEVVSIYLDAKAAKSLTDPFTDIRIEVFRVSNKPLLKLKPRLRSEGSAEIGIAALMTCGGDASNPADMSNGVFETEITKRQRFRGVVAICAGAHTRYKLWRLWNRQCCCPKCLANIFVPPDFRHLQPHFNPYAKPQATINTTHHQHQ